MKTEAFDYELPRGFIAQHPAAERDSSRLLVLDRRDGKVEHRHFRDIRGYFAPGDVLVLNDSKVIPARLEGRKSTGGVLEILLVEQKDDVRWYCLVNGAKRSAAGMRVTVGDAQVDVARNGQFWVAQHAGGGDLLELAQRYGSMPLPHYIRRRVEGPDETRYQTVYASEAGSVAAPTAGLHFTPELLGAIREVGVDVIRVTLHIGVGTFFLIKTENVEDHEMHRERYMVPDEAAARLNEARRAEKRIVAVGTSSVRTLESAFAEDPPVLSGYSRLFIYPGYRFRMVGALLTNFHLPRSTPLMLASAFAGKKNLASAYNEAIDRGYRFYSYGDAMLIV